MISRFFSKSRRFEGQCQRPLRKGSPSSPVIFHQGGNWKWSIYSTWDAKKSTFWQVWQDLPGLTGSCPETRFLARSCQTCQILPGLRSCQNPGWSQDLARSAKPARNRDFGQICQNPRFWPDLLKSWLFRKIVIFAKISIFPEILDFRISDPNRIWAHPTCYMWDLKISRAHDSWQSVQDSNMSTASPYLLWHIDTLYDHILDSYNASIL